jgi:hypothetical protein
MSVRLSVLAALCLAPVLTAAPAAPAKPKSIDVALCLDTSNSMDGLIDSARRKLWTIVNDLARIEPAPKLRVALYSFGNDTYSKDAGWVRKDLDLTTDLDEVYRQLYALRTKGGTEYAARAGRDALKDLAWTEGPDAIRILFVCGNEAATQDPTLSLENVAAEAKAKKVFLNTIYCGPATDNIYPGWKQYAALAGGKSANIDQESNRPDPATPFDAELTKLSTKINETYCWYGAKGDTAKRNQVAQDTNAAKEAVSVAADRGITKGGGCYTCPEADLIDRMLTDKTFDLKKIKDEELPEDMKKMKPEEREAHLKKKAAQRAEIQKQIAELAAKRAKFIADERKKEPRSAADQKFDEALKTVLREQTGR